MVKNTFFYSMVLLSIFMKGAFSCQDIDLGLDVPAKEVGRMRPGYKPSVEPYIGNLLAEGVIRPGDPRLVYDPVRKMLYVPRKESRGTASETKGLSF